MFFHVSMCEYLCAIYLVVIRCQYCEMTLGRNNIELALLGLFVVLVFFVLFVNCTTVVYVKQIRNECNKPVLYQ